MKTKLILTGSLMFLSACSPTEQLQPSTDQCLRREIFMECIKTAQQNLSNVHLDENGDGIGDVVRACESSAFYMSKRPRDQIKPGCTFN